MAVETAPEGHNPPADRPLRGGRFEPPDQSDTTPVANSDVEAVMRG